MQTNLDFRQGAAIPFQISEACRESLREALIRIGFRECNGENYVFSDRFLIFTEASMTLSETCTLCKHHFFFGRTSIARTDEHLDSKVPGIRCE